MDEFTIGFEDTGVWRELTFRGVSQDIAKAMATGLADAGFALVTLTGSQPTVINLTEAATPAPTGSTGSTGGSTGATGSTAGSTGSTGAIGATGP